MTPTEVCVVGGGLAGITAALDLADAGARVELVERRLDLGGATRSFRRGCAWVDNGHHVFLGCCTAYQGLLDRLGVRDLVQIQGRLDVPVFATGGRRARLRADPLPAPFHLARALSRYGHLTPRERFKAMKAAQALQHIDPADRSADAINFGQWLLDHGQSPRVITALWDVVCKPALNLPSDQSSLALAAKVFRTGLLESRDGGAIGWSKVPLGRLHGNAARCALAEAGVEVRTGWCTRQITTGASGFVVHGPSDLQAEAVVVALPHTALRGLLPDECGIDVEQIAELGTSPIVNVHLVFDRAIMSERIAYVLDSRLQCVFDRTEPSGIRRGQAIAVTLSAADEALLHPPACLVKDAVAALREIFPLARLAQLEDAVVTKERFATFRGRPGSADMRPGPRTDVPGLTLAGAWTDTGWPATMEGAVRSGHAAASATLQALGSGIRPGVAA